MGEARQGAVAVSGSAVAEMRRRALVDAGTTILLVDADMRVLMASAGLDPAAGAATLVGASLVDALDASEDGDRLAQAVSRALAGRGGEVSLGARAGGRRNVRCVPVEGDLDGDPAALVVISDERPERPGAAEIDRLRDRARDLETLSAAARALARSTYSEETKTTICESAADVAQAEIAALLELRPDGSGYVIAASCGADLEGRTVSPDRAALAARAFSGGGPSFSADLGNEGPGSGWPLRQAGALSAIWQPVRRAIGIRGVIVVGWRRPTAPPSERLLGSLDLLAGEAAVAIDRAAELERLTGMARTDPLTELSNRRAWQDELSRELARAERGGLHLSIGMIDLDELKSYNDQWGHAAGDRVLLTAAARWRRRLRLTDLLARIGGDEFAVTMPGCSLAEATALADQLRSALPDGLSCSVGVAEWSTGESAEELLARADQALYAAKNAGRDATFSLAAPGGTATGRSVPS